MTAVAFSSRRSWLIAVVVLLAAATAWLQGLRVGADEVFPGPMNRHRDAVAIALTWTAYGEWRGYASFRKVVQALNDNGLSIHPEDVRHTGKRDYFEVLRSPDVVNAAISKAAHLSEPGTDGLYYLNDESGMALFYIAAFSIFGENVAAAFHLYALVLALSAALFLFAFRRNPEALLLLLALLCAQVAAIAICQRLEPDVNAIQSGRFLPLLSLIAVLHLVLLSAFRKPPTLATVLAAAVQMAVFLLVWNARSSAIWELLLLCCALAWFGTRHLLRGSRSERGSARFSTAAWPAVLVIGGLLLQYAHVSFGYHPQFRESAGRIGHAVFWHSLTTAVHNNPARSARFGVQPGVPVWDDAIVYALFKREIARRGQKLEDYLVNDGNWRLRTSDPTFDYVWSRYDAVVKDLFIEVVRSDPMYALKSFAVYQTRDAFSALRGMVREHWRAIMHPAVLGPLVLGTLILGAACLQRAALVWGVLVATLAFSALPAYASAIVSLRVMDSMLVLLTMLNVALAQALAMVVTFVLARRNATAEQKSRA